MIIDAADEEESMVKKKRRGAERIDSPGLCRVLYPRRRSGLAHPSGIKGARRDDQ